MKYTLHCTIYPNKPRDQWPALELLGKPVLFDTEREALDMGRRLERRGVAPFYYEARPYCEAAEEKVVMPTLFSLLDLEAEEAVA